MKLKVTLTTGFLLIFFTDVATIFKNKFKENQCSNYNIQLVNLFSIMCSNIANGTNNTLRDACIGCFQRASNVNNQPSVSAIVECATTYLLNTNYSSCFNLPTIPITTTTVSPTTTTPPGIDPRLKRSININLNCDGYCNYVRCIRNINANMLIAGCFAEARVSNNATYPDQQVALYKNITSCILAKSRCSDTNPISGQSQNGRYTTQTITKFGTTTTMYYYTLQVAQNGELRIIALPGTISVQQDFCSLQSNLMESSWNNFVC